MKTEYYRVTKRKNPAVEGTYTWDYQCYKNNRRLGISFNDLNVLKDEVYRLGLPWGLHSEKKELQITEEEFEKAVELRKFSLKDREEYFMKHRKLSYLYLQPIRKSSTGIARVSTINKDGSTYYRYKITVEGDAEEIIRKDLEELHFEVCRRFLPWEEVPDDEEEIRKINDYKKKLKQVYRRINTTGYFRVSKYLDSYRYCIQEKGKKKSIYAKTIPKLKEKVIAQGYEWEELWGEY